MVDTEENRQLLTRQILTGMVALVQGVRRSFPTTIDDLDITMRQCRAIMVLAEAPASMSKLAHTISASLPSTTGLVDRLVQRGMVSRHEDAHDRRLVICELTPKGREVIDAFAQADREVFTLLLVDLPVEELSVVQAAVAILGRQVDLQSSVPAALNVASA
jgi:DNA-binding MarR family transcriptional regulator